MRRATRAWPGLVDPGVVHLVVAAEGDMGERADQRYHVDERRCLDIGQATLGQGDRVAGHQRQGAGPFDDVAERQPELGQRAQITGADRAAAVQVG